MAKSYSVAGLFSGIGGVELGLQQAGHRTRLLCEWWEPAKAVLGARFPEPVEPDVRTLQTLRRAQVVTAGFPCTDLSQAGRMAGIAGQQSGLVAHVFRLLDGAQPSWLVLENVKNMLALDGGRAMRYLIDELEHRGYNWAYRLVDSRFTGVPQRRQRVILAASRRYRPQDVLLVDDAGTPPADRYREDAYGFYWTEGRLGLGWAQDAVPTLKGGSTIGIASPPAVWLRDAAPGRKLITLSVEDAEALQGFPRHWTDLSGHFPLRRGVRWKMVGNAVTVGVADWIGRRLAAPGRHVEAGRPLALGDKWPSAAWGGAGQAWRSEASMWPELQPYRHLRDVISLDDAPALSHRAAAGFLARTERSRLNFNQDFLLDVKEHVEFTRP